MKKCIRLGDRKYHMRRIKFRVPCKIAAMHQPAPESIAVDPVRSQFFRRRIPVYDGCVVLLLDKGSFVELKSRTNFWESQRNQQGWIIQARFDASVHVS